MQRSCWICSKATGRFCTGCEPILDIRTEVQDFKKILERRMGTSKSKRKQILEELYTNPKASTSTMARKVGTSESYMGRIKREAGLT